jgi:hypothetical protein
MNGRRSSDECISQFDAVALCKLSQVIPGPPADFHVDWDALNGGKERFQNLVFLRSRSMP